MFDVKFSRPALAFAAALISSTALSIAAPATAHAAVQAVATTVHYHTVKVDGIDIFYREAGPAGAPVVLLLHGFPTFLTHVPQSDSGPG